MKKFLIYLTVIIVAISLGFAIFYLVRDDEYISISTSTVYKDAGDEFIIELDHQNPKKYTTIDITTSNSAVVEKLNSSTFKALTGGVARVNFKTSNVKFRNLWCDVIVGDGTEEYPFFISTPEQLSAIGNNAEGYENYTDDACYKLICDIDLSTYNDGYWKSLPTFKGKFDGNGFTIKNMNIDENVTNTGDSYIGLFRQIGKGATVYNLKFDNVIINGNFTSKTVGVVAGSNFGTIERIEVKRADIRATVGTFGGIVGENITSEVGSGENYTRYYAIVDRCSVSNMILGKTIVTSGEEVNEQLFGVTGIIGGLVGKNIGGNIKYSYVAPTCEIYFGSNNITYGGLVAEYTFINFDTIANGYTDTFAGGQIRECYSAAKTFMASKLTLSGSNVVVGGVIGKYTDAKQNSTEYLKCQLVGNYYDVTSLNLAETDYTKSFKGVGQFVLNGTTKYLNDSEYFIKSKLSTAFLNTVENINDFNLCEVIKIYASESGENVISRYQIKWHFSHEASDDEVIWYYLEGENNGYPLLSYQVITIDEQQNVGKTVYKTTTEVLERIPFAELTIAYIDENGIVAKVGDVLSAKKFTPSNSQVTWSSSNTTIAQVDSSTGVVTCKAMGYTVITATTTGKVYNTSGVLDTSMEFTSGYKISYLLIVKNHTASISVTPSSLNLQTDATYKLNATVKVDDETLTNPTISWGSSNSSIATVSSTGLVTAISSGNATITGTYIDTNKGINVSDTTSVAVSAKATTVITLSSSNISMYVGDTRNLVLYCNGASVSGANWTTSNSSVASVSVSGTTATITGNKVGTATITASYSGKSVTCAVTVNAKSVIIEDTDKFNGISKNTLTLYKDSTYKLIASYTGSPSINWSTADSSIVTIGSTTGYNCIITAKAVGSTTITATDGVNTYYCYVTVKAKVEEVFSNEIYTCCDLAKLQDYPEKDFILCANIDMSICSTHSTWTPISYYNGTLSCKGGNTYNIYHLNVSSTTNAGLFGELGSNANISNLIFYDANVNGTTNAGVVAGINNGTIKNIKVQVSTVTANVNVGGIAGINNKLITSVNIYKTNIYLNATSSTNTAGGVSGLVSSSATVSSAMVYGSGEIKCNQTNNSSKTILMGGIVGSCTGLTSGSTFKDCYIKATYDTSKITKYVGGIVGKLCNNGKITSCYVNADIQTDINSNSFAGGILGYLNSSAGKNNDINVLRCGVNSAYIRSYYAGGLVGYLKSTQSISIYWNNTDNYFADSDDLNKSSTNYNIDINQCAVSENVTIGGVECGGLAGIMKNGVMSDCYTMAKLEGINKSSKKAGFAPEISSEIKSNSGNSGKAVAIVERSYSACTFSSSNGDNYSLTASWAYQKTSNETLAPIIHGYLIDCAFDDDADGNADKPIDGFWVGYTFGHKCISQRTTSEMQNSSTFSEMGWGSKAWHGKTSTSSKWYLKTGSYMTLTLKYSM